MDQNVVISAVNFARELSFSFFLADAQSACELNDEKIWISFLIWDFLASGGEENQIKNKIVAIMQEID